MKGFVILLCSTQNAENNEKGCSKFVLTSQEKKNYMKKLSICYLQRVVPILHIFIEKEEDRAPFASYLEKAVTF